MPLQIIDYTNLEPQPGIPEDHFLDKDKERKELWYAVNEGVVEGRLKGIFLTNTLFYVIEIRVLGEGEHAQVHQAFCDHLLSELSAPDMEVLSWKRPEMEAVNIYLEKVGFKVHKRKVIVEKDLANYSMPYDHAFTFKSLLEVGRDLFTQILANASVGDPFSDFSSQPEKEFEELMEIAGERFDPNFWQVAYLNEVPVGVVLPQIYNHTSDEGSLFYVGIIPEYREQGLGKVLHAYGLEILSKSHVLKYIGSTDKENEQMLKVFVRNGCVQTNMQLFYRVPSSGK